MKRYTNNIFKDISELECFEELLKLVSENSIPDSRLVRMWRGQSNVNWRIHSAAYRRLNIENPNVSESDLCFYEERLLIYAKHKGYHIVEGRTLSDFELLAFLQHNGAATRLVDFSRNMLVALWFCISSNSNLTGLLIGAHAWFLGGYEGEGGG